MSGDGTMSTTIPPARTADPSTVDTTNARGTSVRLIRRLATCNLFLVALQPLSAGFLMSGFPYARAMHADVAIALELGVLTQAIAGLMLWRRGKLPAATAAASVALFAGVFLQAAFGHTHRYWLHVPIGVGLTMWVSRQVNKMGAFLSTTAGADQIT